MRVIALTITLLVARVASADAIGMPDACPPGTRADNSHAGTWCVAATCDGGCRAIDGRPETCRPMRLCTETREIHTSSPVAEVSGFDVTLADVEMVVATCAPDERCDGTVDRAPTVGELRAGSARCFTADVCTADPLPPLSSRTVAVPAPPSAPAASVAAPAPSAATSTFGCRAGARSSVPPWWVLLALALLPRRRAAVTAVMVLGLALGSAAPASAQLTEPFVERTLPVGFGQLQVLACAGDMVYARSWQGDAAVLRDGTWTALDDVPDGDVGANLAVQDGVLYTTVRGGIARWADGHWTREDAPIGALYTSQIFAAGGHALAVGTGRVVAWDGSRYAAYDAGTWRDLFAIWGTSETDLWVAGGVGTALHFDGRAMTAHPIATEGTIQRLHGTSTRDVWAIVRLPDGVFHWDGAQWTDRSAGLGGQPAGVFATADTAVAVGAFGVVRWAGDHWDDVQRLEVAPYALSPFTDVCVTTTSIVVAGRETTWMRPR